MLWINDFIAWSSSAFPASETPLTAIAGVAVVVWTGALIAIQVKEGATPRSALALLCLRFAFLAPLIGLLFHDAHLRIVAIVSAVVYTGWLYQNWRFAKLPIVSMTVRGGEAEERTKRFADDDLIRRRGLRWMQTYGLSSSVLLFLIPSNLILSIVAVLPLSAGLSLLHKEFADRLRFY